ncbi:MAG: transporter permease [Actinomycetota bacterium]|jgi:ABC-2 type transport system permease protein|nr:transporter permease [Actinomycetota bacterium]
MTTTTLDTTAEEAGTLDDSKLRSVLGNRVRPDRPGAVSASLTFGWRAMLKIKHVPEQLFDVTMFPIMFTLLFTYLFGGALEGSPTAYIQILAPGILVQTVIFITMYAGMGLNNDIKKGVFDRFRSLPIWRPAPMVGLLLGDAVRFILASLVVLTLSLIIGFRPEGGVIGVVAGIGLTLVFAFSISWIWTLLGLVMRTPEAVLNTAMTILFPVIFASNIFVNPDTMPGWLQTVVDLNPITHLVSAVRGLMGTGAETSDLIWVFASSAALIAIFAPLTMRRYSRL